MPSVRIGDIDVAYDHSGTGDPMVFLHGLAEDKTTWQHQLNDLSGNHRLAYDLRGHGGTSTGQAAGTLEQLGTDLIGFLETITGPATVVGFSLGGTITLWAAAQRPDLVEHAIVLGTSSVVGRAAVGFYEKRIRDATNTATDDFFAALREDTRLALARPADDLDGLTQARLEAVGSGGGYRNAAQAMMALNAEPLTPRLGEIQVPVDVIAGSDDTFCPAKASQIIVDALPDVRFHEISGVGHLMNVDDPAAVTGAIQTALQKRN